MSNKSDGLELRRRMVVELAWSKAISVAHREQGFMGVPLVTTDRPGQCRCGEHPANEQFLKGWGLYCAADWTGDWNVWGWRDGEYFSKRGKVKL